MEECSPPCVFFMFLNWANRTKSRSASHMKNQILQFLKFANIAISLVL